MKVPRPVSVVLKSIELEACPDPSPPRCEEPPLRGMRAVVSGKIHPMVGVRRSPARDSGMPDVDRQNLSDILRHLHVHTCDKEDR